MCNCGGEWQAKWKVNISKTIKPYTLNKKLWTHKTCMYNQKQKRLEGRESDAYVVID